MQIIFIDSMSGYERLLDRLFKVNNEDQELFIGFDCMLFYSILSSITYPEIWRGEQISFRRCGRFPLEMYHLLQRCASPALTSTSPAGDTASPARDVFASPNCGIWDTAAENTRFFFSLVRIDDQHIVLISQAICAVIL